MSDIRTEEQHTAAESRKTWHSPELRELGHPQTGSGTNSTEQIDPGLSYQPS